MISIDTGVIVPTSSQTPHTKAAAANEREKHRCREGPHKKAVLCSASTTPPARSLSALKAVEVDFLMSRSYLGDYSTHTHERGGSRSIGAKKDVLSCPKATRTQQPHVLFTPDESHSSRTVNFYSSSSYDMSSPFQPVESNRKTKIAPFFSSSILPSSFGANVK